MPSIKEKRERLEFQKRLGNHIAEVRKLLGYTQSEIAKGARIHQANIARIESGMKNPSAFVLKKVCVGMKISLSRLLKGLK